MSDQDAARRAEVLARVAAARALVERTPAEQRQQLEAFYARERARRQGST